MKVIIVRHGESVGGQQKVHQSEDMALSPLGRKQAQTVSRLLQKSSASYVVSSQLLRGRETASIIGDTLRLEVRENRLLNEWRRPSELIGQPYEDTEVKRIKKLIRDRYSDPVWHYSDEENFSDIIQRAKHVLALLESDEHDKIVVSHARLLSIILWLLMADAVPTNPNDYIQRQEELHLGFCETRILYLGDNGWHV
jgi:broad specificity phosphatase PhoE